MRTILKTGLCTLFVALSSSLATAQSDRIGFQARLTDDAGQVLPDGAVNLAFSIYDEQGSLVEGPIAVTDDVSGGLVSTGIPVTASSFDGTPRFIGVSVNGGAELVPRFELQSVVRSIEARKLVDASGDVELRYSGEALTLRRTESFANFDTWVFANSNPVPGILGFGVRSANKPHPQTGTFWWLTLDQDNGYLGIGTETPNRMLDVEGRARSHTLEITGGSDLAEPFASAPGQETEPVPGMVLSIDPAHPGALRVSEQAYDTKVAGVYSGGNGLPTGMVMGKDGCELTRDGQGRLHLAMTGRVWVFADDSNGEIRPGDRLTTSGVNPGHAARATDSARAGGAVIGKAMTPIDEETGMLLVLVNLQ